MASIEYLLKKNKINTLGFKNAYKKIVSFISENEDLIDIRNGNINLNPNYSSEINVNVISAKGKKPAIVAITNKNIIGNEDYLRIPIQEVREYSFKRNVLAGSVLRVKTINGGFELDLNYKKETIETITKALDEAKNYKENFVVNNQNGQEYIQQIKELSELKNIGIITEKEFEQKKKEILERI